GAESAQYHITAVDPVDLAANSPSVTALPPAYAAGAVDKKTTEGLAAELACVQYGKFAFEARFSRPVKAAFVEFTPAAHERDRVPGPVVGPLTLSPEGDTPRGDLPAVAAAHCRIVAEVEQGLRQEFPAQSVFVQVDKPPSFARVEGVTVTEQPRQARPDEKLPISATVLDDLGVAAVEVEYQVGDGEVKR